MSAESVAESIPAGYKQTEVGVIPEDWEIKVFGEIFNISGGLSASRNQLSVEGHCYLHYGDIHTSKKTCIYVQSEQQDITKLDIPLNKVPTKSFLEDGDIVFVDASEDDEGTSKHIVIFNKDKIPFISGLHTIVAKSKKNELHHHYRRYCFQATNVKQQFRFFAVGTKVSGISKKNIAKIMLPIPSLPEQEAIAQALTDADAFIESMEQLIAKKRLIKQGAMQELFTGKRRLPGFVGKWEVKSIADLAILSKTGMNPALSPDEVFTHFSLPAFDNGTEPIIEKGYCIGSNKFTVPNNAILLSKLNPRIPRVWAPSYIPKNAICSTEFLVLVPKEGTDRNFLTMLCWSPLVCYQMEQHAIGTTGSHQRIHPHQALAIEVYIPEDKKEQTAIATIFSDMDAEIAVLVGKLEKSRKLKQGIMQELLTGRIRLI